MRRYTLTFLLLSLLAGSVIAGTGYQVTSTNGEKTVTYTVNFGGGKMFEQYTAFDPATKKFVYLKWRRGTDAPKPVAAIWDHQTGKTIKLYEFPNVEHPLPIIPSIEAMKVCPLTGDKDFKAQRRIMYD